MSNFAFAALNPLNPLYFSSLFYSDPIDDATHTTSDFTCAAVYNEVSTSLLFLLLLSFFLSIKMQIPICIFYFLCSSKKRSRYPTIRLFRRSFRSTATTTSPWATSTSILFANTVRCCAFHTPPFFK